MKINSVNQLKGSLKVPGDKSISHRSVMIGALAKGTTRVSGFLTGADCLSTIACFRKMGINIEQEGEHVTIFGKGLAGLTMPMSVLDVGNSGTTMRLMSGILSGQDFSAWVTGDASIKKRPMERIITPLTQMGARIRSKKGDGLAPLYIEPSELKGITYESPVASAQIKSCILLAGLYAKEKVTVLEPAISRNHSEIMLNHFGAKVTTEGFTVVSHPVSELHAQEVVVPADISSAAFFLVAGLIVPKSEILLKDVGINPTRDGIIKVLKAMNGDIELKNQRTIGGELVADILVRHSQLTGTVVGGKDLIPTLIDEIPAIAVAAAYAEGETVIKDAQELKVKETNRIGAMVSEMTKLNVDITPTDDGMIIKGGREVIGATVASYHDHRVAMALAVAGLQATGTTLIKDSGCVAISYPNFEEDLQGLVWG